MDIKMNKSCDIGQKKYIEIVLRKRILYFKFFLFNFFFITYAQIQRPSSWHHHKSG